MITPDATPEIQVPVELYRTELPEQDRGETLATADTHDGYEVHWDRLRPHGLRATVSIGGRAVRVVLVDERRLLAAVGAVGLDDLPREVR